MGTQPKDAVVTHEQMADALYTGNAAQPQGGRFVTIDATAACRSSRMPCDR